ncbi:MAG: M14 family zinc carboxypeptidase [Vicinamibacterales bacterium]
MRSYSRFHSFAAAGAAAALALSLGAGATAQQARPATTGAPQKQDQEYTAKIREALQDPRITTELVDHLPASDTVPTPLKFLGRYVGQPGELTYAKDIARYYQELARVSPRAKYWKIGTTEEGRDIVALAVADEATIKNLESYRTQLASLTDPRKTTDVQAAALLKTAKPIYYILSGIHSPENGGPEMLIELAYRLIVEETPFIQSIRNNVITLITPVIEVDGREKQVDTYYFNKTRAQGDARLPLMYWGKYVQHDNNRDGMGQFLELTKTVTRMQLQWTPTIMHDLHEAQTYLYSSTGTGPYNDALDPITISEWWLLAQTDVMEMAKRGVPGVFTYGFYDGWVPNYMFFIAHSHNAIGRFYEVQSYGPDNYTARAGATTTSKEWFRPNPPLPEIKWGPRNNTNIQESALLLSMHYVAEHRTTFLENYWMKNKRSVEKGKRGPVYAWHIPANQRRKADTADAVNELLRQGLEIQRATSAFTAGGVSVAAGDYIVRGDQPYRTLADMYFSVQNYPPQNPRPYDDTGWTFQYMRDLTIAEVKDASVLSAAMAPVTGPVTAAGGVQGTGSTLVVDHTADNALVTFRFKNPSVKMAAAEEDFELAGHRFRAGAVVVPNADRATLEPMLKDLGLSAWAVDAPPAVKTHDLDIPRIGYVHSWTRTQDEGWVRAALDTYGVPYTYFADQKLREGSLRAKYDVIIFPHVGGTPTSQVNGMAMTGKTPLPYKKTDKTPNLAYVDSSDDIRGGMGLEGLLNLVQFVQEGGTLITEGSTSTILPEYGVTSGITVESPPQLFVRGSIVRGKMADLKSPLAYGFDASDLPVYFNQDPVLNVAAGGPGAFRGFFGGGAANAGLGQNVTPNAQPLRIQPLESAPAGDRGGRAAPDEMAQFRSMAAQFGITIDETRPRVVVAFSQNPADLLLSGTIAGAQGLTGKAALVDAALGKGHVVMFAIRPFWRWQTQGTFSLGFNALMNWNDLDAGKADTRTSTSRQ